MVRRTEKGVRRTEKRVRRTEKGVRRTEKWVRRTEIVIWGHRSIEGMCHTNDLGNLCLLEGMTDCQYECVNICFYHIYNVC